MKLPPLTALRAFEAAARLTSFSKAAEELNVTHAAISHQIKHLEEWFGRPLFRREGRGIKPTNAGHQLYLSTNDAFVNISEKSLSLQKSSVDETIIVGCLASIASRWLVPALPDFYAEQPEHTVQIFYVHTAEHLDDEGYDVLISLEADPATHVSSKKIFSRRSVPVASPYYLERKGALDSVEAIAEADLLHDETREDWGTWFEKAGLEVENAARGSIFADFNMLSTAVIAGHGIALCPTEVFHHEITRGDLIVLSDISTRDDEGYYLVTLSEPAKSVQVFSDWFIDVCSKAT